MNINLLMPYLTVEISASSKFYLADLLIDKSKTDLNLQYLLRHPTCDALFFAALISTIRLPILSATDFFVSSTDIAANAINQQSISS
jgi:hypothetical protein